MKTLYVTDLDGTLLEPDKSIKPENLKLINQLIEEDVNHLCDCTFSYYRKTGNR